MQVKLIPLEWKGDQEGKLISIEEMKNIPFKIKRIYYIYNTAQGIIRGNHSHPNLEQLIIAVSGSCTMLVDDGKMRIKHLLNRPDLGLYIGGNIWREMHEFSPNCVLLVLASQLYEDTIYVRSYDEFISTVKK